MWLSWGEGIHREEVRETRGTIRRKSFSLGGAEEGQGHNGHLQNVTHMAKMIPTERARRDEEVGFGITSFGVVVEKL